MAKLQTLHYTVLGHQTLAGGRHQWPTVNGEWAYGATAQDGTCGGGILGAAGVRNGAKSNIIFERRDRDSMQWGTEAVTPN